MPRQKTFKIHLPARAVPDWQNPESLSEFVQGPSRRAAAARRETSVSDAEPADNRTLREVDVPTEILLPEYAIGVGLITREEYEAVRSDYYTQTQWTLGLIIPLSLLWSALTIGSNALTWWLHALFIALIAVAFIGGMDRLHNYYAQLQSLITGKYVAKLIAREAAEAAASASKPPVGGTAPTLKDLRADLAALKDIIEKELQKRPITVINHVPAPHDHSHEASGAEHAPRNEPVEVVLDPGEPEADEIAAERLAERARELSKIADVLRRRRRETGDNLDIQHPESSQGRGSKGETGS